MKIAVVSLARSGSTKLCNFLQAYYNLVGASNTNRNDAEVLTELVPGEYVSRLSELCSENNYVVKFFPYQLRNLDYMNFVKWESYDYIFFTTRKNLVDMYVSFQIAYKQHKWIKSKTDLSVWGESEFNVGVENIPQFANDLALFDKICNDITTVASGTLLHYDDLVDNSVIASKLNLSNDKITDKLKVKLALNAIYCSPTDIDYKVKCINYIEVESKFKELGII